LVEVAKPHGHTATTKVVGDFFLFKAGGAVLVTLASSVMIDAIGPRATLGWLAYLPLGLLTAILRFESQKDWVAPPLPLALDNTLPANATAVSPWNVFRDQQIWGPLAFLCVYNIGPNYDDPLYYYFINKLHFKVTFIGQLQMMHAVAKVLGVLLYRYVLRSVPDRQLVVGLTLVSIPLYMTPLLLTSGAYQSLGIDPRSLALSGELVRELFIHLQMMPAFARWVRICPAGLEGTVVSLLISCMNISRALSKGTSAGTAAMLGVTADDFSSLSQLIMICGGSMLIPLSIAHWLPNDVVPDDAEQLEDGSSPRVPLAAALENDPASDNDRFTTDDAPEPRSGDPPVGPAYGGRHSLRIVPAG